MALFRQWIDLGAPYDKPLLDDANCVALRCPKEVTDRDPQFWSFAPLADPVPPEVENEAWTETGIDRFLLAEMELAGVERNGRVDWRGLIRRAYLGVTGLPPTPEQVEAFLHDDSPQAWERVVDQFVASPRYGERWARHWLDVARYAESHGFEQDYNRPHAYHYRDFVIPQDERHVLNNRLVPRLI